MAEFTIVLIPEDVRFVPSTGAIEAAKSLMADYFPYRGNEVESEISRNPRFICSHDNFEQLSCPECGEAVSRFELDENEEGETWWDHFEKTIDEADDATAVSVSMPCCNTEVKVTDIDFGRDAGFSMFELSLRDPGDDIEVTEGQKMNLENTLGCKLIQITRVDS